MKLLQSKDEIKNKIKKFREQKIEVVNIWNSEKIEETKNFNICAIDGSFNLIKFKDFVLYAIDICKVELKDKIYKFNYPEIDIIYNFFGIEEFLKLKMITKEIEVALESETELTILDGSISSFYHYKPYIIEFSEEFYKMYENKNEKIKKLKDKNVISISKTSSKKSVSEISDISLFKDLSEGYSKIFVEKGEINFYYFFYKFENFDVFKIESLKQINQKEVLKVLKFISVNGYPFLLTLAHRNSLVTLKDLKIIAKYLGIYEKTGREML